MWCNSRKGRESYVDVVCCRKIAQNVIHNNRHTHTSTHDGLLYSKIPMVPGIVVFWLCAVVSMWAGWPAADVLFECSQSCDIHFVMFVNAYTLPSVDGKYANNKNENKEFWHTKWTRRQQRNCWLDQGFVWIGLVHHYMHKHNNQHTHTLPQQHNLPQQNNNQTQKKKRTT